MRSVLKRRCFKKPYKPLGVICSTRKLQCVHSDVFGLMSTEYIGGKRYFVTFIDDYFRCSKEYFMRKKLKYLTNSRSLSCVQQINVVSPLEFSNQTIVASACQMIFNLTCSLKEYITSYQLHTHQLRME